VLYEAALPIADRLDLTLVDAEVEGDTSFPAFDREVWREVERLEHPADDENRFGFRVTVLERAEPTAPPSTST
jgi:dihydrofolate reductase